MLIHIKFNVQKGYSRKCFHLKCQFIENVPVVTGRLARVIITSEFNCKNLQEDTHGEILCGKKRSSSRHI